MDLFFLIVIIVVVSCEKQALNISAPGNSVEESQHAICSISTEEVQASANASSTRQLKGVCTSEELEKRIGHLEQIIIKEIVSLKLMLQSAGYTTPRYHEEKQQTQSTEDYDYEDNSLNSSKTNNLELKQDTPEQSGRESEIKTHNMSYSLDGREKAFIYYWKINNFHSIHNASGYIDSASFNLTGHKLFVRLNLLSPQVDEATLQIADDHKDHFKAYQFTILNRNIEKDLKSEQVEATGLYKFVKSNLNSDFNLAGDLIIKVKILLF